MSDVILRMHLRNDSIENFMVSFSPPDQIFLKQQFTSLFLKRIPSI